MQVTDRPPEFRLPMLQGAPMHKELGSVAVSRTTGEPFDLSNWTARLDLATSSGMVVVSFATADEPGVITMNEYGEISFDISGADTAALAATVEIAGVIHEVLRGNFIVTSPEDIPYWRGRAVAEIARSVSA